MPLVDVGETAAQKPMSGGEEKKHVREGRKKKSILENDELIRGWSLGKG